MRERDSIVADTVGRIFSDYANPQVAASLRGPNWRDALWRALQDNGLTLACVENELGGAGGSLEDSFEIARISGRYAVSVPIIETMLAGFLLSRANLNVPIGAMSVAPSQPTDRITIADDGMLRGRARAVAFADEAGHFVVFAEGSRGDQVALIAAADCKLSLTKNLAGDVLGNIDFNGVTPLQTGGVPQGFNKGVFLMHGSVMRSRQIAGSLQYILERTVEYAGERVAFGKKIGSFQSIQNNLARLAAEVAAAEAAAGSAADALANAREWPDGVFLEAAAAKVRCADAATLGVAIAHQVHGAIGLTMEYVLCQFTLRALSWREDFGDETYWAVKLGELVAALGGDALWPLVASR